MQNLSPLGIFAAAGICASLAMLGSEIDAQHPSVIRYEYSIVLPNPPADDEDGADSSPQQDDQNLDRHRWHHGNPRDDDRDGHPDDGSDSDDTIPM